MSDKEMRIEIEIEGYTSLGVEEVWSMDKPENPTIDDVMSLIKKEGSLVKFLEAWSMGDQFDVCVTVGDQTRRIRSHEW